MMMMMMMNRSLQKEGSEDTAIKGAHLRTCQIKLQPHRPRSILGSGSVTAGFTALGLAFRSGTTFGSGTPLNGQMHPRRKELIQWTL